METSMDEWVIEARDLRKSFGNQIALDGLQLQVPPGSIHGFLGKNGAGKTTTIELLLNIVKSDSGHATIFGVPITDVRRCAEIGRRIGSWGEEKGLYPYTPAVQTIRFTRPFFPAWRHYLERRYLEAFSPPRHSSVRVPSADLAHRLLRIHPIARAPDLLILAEPTDRLDPAA